MFDPDWSSWAESVIRQVEGEEKDELFLRLLSEWDVEGSYWFPLRMNQTPPAHTEAFQAAFFEKESTHETLQQILAARGVDTMFEMREDGQTYESELAQFHPVYTGLEGFWFTAKLDWLIYASHEGSLTIGGEWLLAAVQTAWPDWKEHIWKWPVSE